MAGEPLLDATTHVVAHLLRDTESALRDVLESVIGRSARLSKGKVSGDENHKTEIQTVLKALEIPETDLVAQAWLRLVGKKNEYGLHARAHRDNLARPRSIGREFRQFWDEMQAILDVVLEKFESRYLAVHLVLDELLARDQPTQSDVDVLRKHVPNNLVVFGYFFDRAGPAWLDPLKAKGFFRHSPEAERDEEEGTVGFRSWPESRYLARMASVAPQTVLDIILQIPDTENVRVHEDLTDAALAMPTKLAAELVPKAKIWVESPYPVLLCVKLGALMANLALGGQLDEALALAHSLLAVLPGRSITTEKSGEERSYLFTPEPQGRFDLWHYKQIMKKDMPDLVAACGDRALSLLCDLLDSAITLSQSPQEAERYEDYSHVWYRAIEHQREHPRGVRELLVWAVRNAAEQIVRTNPAQLQSVVENLERRPWQVFQRIVLHLLRMFPDKAPTLVSERLTQPRRDDSLDLWHEYSLLMRERFCHLEKEDQEKILGWIEEGPDIEQFKKSQEEWTGTPPTEYEAERYGTGWRLRRLALIRDCLPREWRQRYEAWVAEFGEPERPEFVVDEISTWVGPTSPKSEEDLHSLRVEQIVAFLKTWEPSQDPMQPSPEGLGRVLAGVVASNPEQFAEAAGQFQELDPTYVRALLSGLRDAAKGQRPLPWRPVLKLCQWVVDQPREIPDRNSEYADLDPGWGWTRKTIADLLSCGFAAGPAEIPFDLRTTAWEILEPLTEDPDPTPEYEARYGGSNMDPAMMTINTTRGEAMHAVVRYALWIRRHIEKLPDGKERVACGFGEMQEVREVFQVHLNPERDPSLTIRSVYGRWFPWLFLLDPGWVKSYLPKIFPEEESLQDLRDVAWDAYIIFCEPYDNVFETLSEEYRRAVECIGTVRGERRQLADPDERLAEHLMTFYWRGKLSLNEPEGLLVRFYVKAPDLLRGHALDFVGQSLHNTEGIVDSEVLDRLQTLWGERINAARNAAQPALYAEELAAFGRWFVCEKFDDAWAINQLKEALELTGGIELDHSVVERLTALVGTMPLLAVECLGLIVEGDKKGWGIQFWRDHARTIICSALQSTDVFAQKAATALVHRLGARGYLDFRDLIAPLG